MSVPLAAWGAVRAKYPQMMAMRVVRGTRNQADQRRALRLGACYCGFS